MAYYSALIEVWTSTTQPPAGVTGTGLSPGMTTAQKLAALNSWTLPGPAHQDVLPSAVVAYLALNYKLAALLRYAQSPPQTAAGIAAAELAALLGMGSNTPTFQMSNPVVYGAIANMLLALATDPNSGVTSVDVSNLLALATIMIQWWQSAGYPGPLAISDVQAAGLT